MELDINDVVAVMGFCWLLWWCPFPYMLMPALAALIFPLYPVEAAWVAYVSGLLMGSLTRLFEVGKS